MSKREGPLSGLLVLDLTRILAGPFCTQILGDLGAQVIKIERPGLGDDTRRFAPPFLKNSNGEETKESAYFIGTNRNKRSVVIDIAKPDGQALIRKIAEKSDVLVENFKLGNLSRYGLGYDDLKLLNPGVVYCSITGFGQTGPYAERPGYDPLIQAMGGFMSVTGEPDGEPMKAGVPIADIMAGMYASVGINAALRSREIDGKGQYIDIGMLDTQIAWLSIQAMNYLLSGKEPTRLGNAHPNIVPYQVFKTSDGYIMVTIGNDEQFYRFCNFANCPELSADARFSTNGDRVTNRDILIPLLEQIFLRKETTEWLNKLDALSIGCGPINDVEQVFADPHVRERRMVVNMPHEALAGGEIPVVASPIRLSETPVSYRHAPPVLGADTEQVLKELLGLDKAVLKRLAKKNVI